jgi:hypothetical protein
MRCRELLEPKVITLAECVALFEDQPRRLHDPGVAAWLDKAYASPNADRLYLHGSNHRFDRFADPNVENGHLIHFTKLTKENWPPGAALQAEYYGANLYLVTIHARKPFRPLNDPAAKAILQQTLEGAWNSDYKVRWGCFDYQDQYRVIPVAAAAGYDLFRIHECSVQGDSIGVTKGDMITIVDRYPDGE